MRDAVAHAREADVVDAEREDVHVGRKRGRALTQTLGRDEHEIRLAKERVLAHADTPCTGRAGREVVDAVVDDQRRIEAADQIAGERGGQEGPRDGPAEAGGAHPALDRPQEERAVHAPGEPRVRQRHDDRRVDEEVRQLLAKPVGAAPPVSQAIAHARDVTERRAAHPGVLDEEDAVAVARERGHHVLMTLPEEVPVDRRDADDVGAGDHRVPRRRL